MPSNYWKDMQWIYDGGDPRNETQRAMQLMRADDIWRFMKEYREAERQYAGAAGVVGPVVEKVEEDAGIDAAIAMCERVLREMGGEG